MVQKHVLKTVKKGTGQREVRPVWNNAMSVNHQNFSNSRKFFARTAVLTKSIILPISTARQSSSRVAAPETSPFSQTIKNMIEDLLLLQAILKEMCDKKNSVLFTETEWLILSLDFNLPDENQVLLKVPRKNNMYSFDLKNVVPLKGLTCLFAKATNDESNLWHKRLGHINFKTMNILVKGNLVRVTILNTLDHLGKFNGKANEGFLVGYSINSKAFRVYNSRTKKVEENLHVKFLENKPNIAGSGPEWLFDTDSLTNLMNYQPVSTGNKTNGIAGSKIHSNAKQEGKEKVYDQEYILLPMLNTSSYVPSSNEEVVSLPKDDAGKKSTVEPTCIEGGKIDDLGCLDQQIKSTYYSENTNSANSFNTASLTVNTASDKDGTFQQTYGKWNFSTPITVNAAGSSFSYPAAFDDFSKMPNLEDTRIFDDAYDDRDDVAEADYNNLETVIPVSPIPSTRIHKDHPKEKIIGEVNSTVKTRKMAKQNEAGLITFINKQRRTNHKDFQNCLFVCFLSQMEPKKTLVDLPYEKRAIGTKWVYKNKRDQRGIVIRNKARLVSQGHREEEVIDYDEVFAPVARIEAIRYLKGQPTLVIWYPEDSPLELISYSDSDYAGASLDRLSTTRGCHFVATNQLPDYEYNFMQTKIHVDNESAICVVKNPVYHSNTNHIEIRHHFIRDSYEKRLIEMVKIHTDSNVADLLTKAFDVTRRTQKATLLPQTSVPQNLRADEAINQEEGNRVEKAITTDTSLEAA
uniref:Uncharacterized protein n=1 Tax=Tanacetum cinerariifolium TaxID=118510 RepID=A0A699HHY8_TANCI|nr:hypothetical protein [Tanacetum cinerariifolium]